MIRTYTRLLLTAALAVHLAGCITPDDVKQDKTLAAAAETPGTTTIDYECRTSAKVADKVTKGVVASLYSSFFAVVTGGNVLGAGGQGIMDRSFEHTCEDLRFALRRCEQDAEVCRKDFDRMDPKIRDELCKFEEFRPYAGNHCSA